MSKRNPKTIVIRDVWYKRKESEIVVEHHEKSKDAFPYESSSERRDQYRNAIFYAQRLVDEHNAKHAAGGAAAMAAGFLLIDDQVDAIQPRKYLRDIVVNGYIVEHQP